MTTAPALGCAVGRELGAVSQSAHGRATALTFSAPWVLIVRTVWDGTVNQMRLASRGDATRSVTEHDKDVEPSSVCTLGAGSQRPLHRALPPAPPRAHGVVPRGAASS